MALQFRDYKNSRKMICFPITIVAFPSHHVIYLELKYQGLVQNKMLINMFLFDAPKTDLVMAIVRMFYSLCQYNYIYK